MDHRELMYAHQSDGTEDRARGADDGKTPGAEVFSDEEWHALSAWLRLSPRQFQIARLIFDDVKEHAMAAELGISECTLHDNLRKLFAKFEVKSRVQFVVRVFDEFLARTRRGQLPPICRRRAVGRCRRSL